MKYFKKIAIVLSVIVTCGASAPVLAHEKDLSEGAIDIIPTIKIEKEGVNKSAVTIGYRKENVKKYNEWGNKVKVSGILATGSAGGSITCTESVTFDTTVSGNITGLGISTSASISSSVGYTLNVGPNKRAQMMMRVKYAVEKGTRVVFDYQFNQVISRNSYTVKKPIDKEYSLKYL